MPHSVLEGVPVLRHVAGEGFCTNGEVNACPLQKVKLLESAQSTPCPKPCKDSIKMAYLLPKNPLSETCGTRVIWDIRFVYEVLMFT